MKMWLALHHIFAVSVAVFFMHPAQASPESPCGSNNDVVGIASRFIEVRSARGQDQELIRQEASDCMAALIQHFFGNRIKTQVQVDKYVADLKSLEGLKRNRPESAESFIEIGEALRQSWINDRQYPFLYGRAVDLALAGQKATDAILDLFVVGMLGAATGSHGQAAQSAQTLWKEYTLIASLGTGAVGTHLYFGQASKNNGVAVPPPPSEFLSAALKGETEFNSKSVQRELETARSAQYWGATAGTVTTLALTALAAKVGVLTVATLAGATVAIPATAIAIAYLAISASYTASDISINRNYKKDDENAAIAVRSAVTELDSAHTPSEIQSSAKKFMESIEAAARIRNAAYFKAEREYALTVMGIKPASKDLTQDELARHKSKSEKLIKKAHSKRMASLLTYAESSPQIDDAEVARFIILQTLGASHSQPESADDLAGWESEETSIQSPLIPSDAKFLGEFRHSLSGSLLKAYDGVMNGFFRSISWSDALNWSDERKRSEFSAYLQSIEETDQKKLAQDLRDGRLGNQAAKIWLQASAYLRTKENPILTQLYVDQLLIPSVKRIVSATSHVRSLKK